MGRGELDYFNGFRVVINPMLDNMPKMTLTRKVYDNLPSPFRDEINAWMRDFFGTESIMLRGGNDTLIMGPKMLEQVKAHAR